MSTLYSSRLPNAISQASIHIQTTFCFRQQPHSDFHYTERCTDVPQKKTIRSRADYHATSAHGLLAVAAAWALRFIWTCCCCCCCCRRALADAAVDGPGSGEGPASAEPPTAPHSSSSCADTGHATMAS